MTTLTECEKLVIEKLIAAFSRALNCQLESNGTDIVDSDVSTVQKLLRVLLTGNDTISVGDGGIGTIVQVDDYAITNESSTNVVTNYSELPIPGNGDKINDGKTGSIGTNKLHKLEIIKVGVLIAVISIIMLTTCRMVFQLFIRFRPEKPPLG